MSQNLWQGLQSCKCDDHLLYKSHEHEHPSDVNKVDDRLARGQGQQNHIHKKLIV